MGEFSSKFRKRELYQEMDLHLLEINADDGDNLDEVLGRGLLAFGIRVSPLRPWVTSFKLTLLLTICALSRSM